MSHPALIKAHQGPHGRYRAVTSIEKDSCLDTGIEFGLLHLQAHEEFTDVSACESVWVLLSGQVQGEFDVGGWLAERTSLFDEGPSVLHLAGGKKLKLRAGNKPVEIAVAKTVNTSEFSHRVFKPTDVPTEYRGKGLAQDTCLREVRQIFDKGSRPDSNLVIGEVINYPGRWSSYPPHHHPQPEIYHYRFSEPQGYGHAELGDDVCKIHHGDTTKILNNVDHGQVSAPGYAMYYLWIIRHLPNNPYLGFEFTEPHKWILNPKNQGWRPQKSL